MLEREGLLRIYILTGQIHFRDQPLDHLAVLFAAEDHHLLGLAQRLHHDVRLDIPRHVLQGVPDDGRHFPRIDKLDRNHRLPRRHRLRNIQLLDPLVHQVDIFVGAPRDDPALLGHRDQLDRNRVRRDRHRRRRVGIGPGRSASLPLRRLRLGRFRLRLLSALPASPGLAALQIGQDQLQHLDDLARVGVLDLYLTGGSALRQRHTVSSAVMCP